MVAFSLVALADGAASGHPRVVRSTNTRHVTRFRRTIFRWTRYFGSAGRNALTLRTRSATFCAPMRSITQAR